MKKNMALIMLVVYISTLLLSTFEVHAADKSELKELMCGGVLQYSESFDNEPYLWKVTNCVVEDGRFTTDYGSGLKRAWLDMSAECGWEEQLITLSFKRGEVFAGGWSGIEICRQDNGSRHLILFGLNYISLLRMDGSSVSLSKVDEYVFDKDTPYDMVIKAQNNTLSIAVKRAWEDEYTVFPSVEVELKRGGFGFAGWNIETSIDNLNIYSLDEDTVIRTKPMLIEKGTSKKICITDENVSAEYLSDNTSVATVDNSGNVTAHATGSAIITVTTEKGKEPVKVCVSDTIGRIALSSEAFSIPAGERVGIEAVLYNTNGSSISGNMPNVRWTVSNSEIIDIYGDYAAARTVVAKKPGKALIRVSNESGTIQKECVVTVTEQPQKGMRYAYFGSASDGRKISDTIFGMFQPQAGNVNVDDNYNRPCDGQLYRDLKVDILRGPDGSTANHYRWRTGDLDNRPLAAGYKGFYIRDAYVFPNQLNIPYCFAVNVSGQTVSDIVDQVKEIRKNTSKTIYIELGNELYDKGSIDVFPTPQDYVNKCKEIYTAVKAADDNIKVGIVIIINYMEYRLRSVPYMGEWNATVAASPECYDAVIPHYYSSMDEMAHMTDDEMMDAFNAYNVELYEEQFDHAEEFPGKEIWVSEYGILLTEFFKQTRTSEYDRRQIAKTHGFAINTMEKLLDMVKSSKVTLSAYNQAIGSNGFGVAQRNGDELIYLPLYYTFKKAGELLADYDYYYDLATVHTDKKTVYSDKYIYPGRVDEISGVGVWGFGDSSEAKKVVISNHFSEPVTVGIDGYKLIQEWSYGGENPLGEDYFTNDVYFHNPPEEIPVPDESTGEPVSNLILEPYTAVVCSLVKNNDKNPFMGLSVGNNSSAVDIDNEEIYLIHDGNIKQIKLKCDGEYLKTSFKLSTNTCSVSPKDGYERGKDYTVEVKTSEDEIKEFNFSTKGTEEEKEFVTAEFVTTGTDVKLGFSEVPSEETLGEIKLYKNGVLSEAVIEKTADDKVYGISPLNGFEASSHYRIVCDTVVSDNANKELLAPQMTEFTTYPQLDKVQLRELVNGGEWKKAIAFEQTDYDETLGGGSIRFSANNPISFTLTDAVIYQQEAPTQMASEPQTPDYSDWNKTQLSTQTVKNDTALVWVPEGVYDDFVLEYTIETSGWEIGKWLWYELRRNTGNSATNVRYASRNSDGTILGEPIWASNHFSVGDTQIGNVSDNEAHKMRVSAIGKNIIVEEYINDGMYVIAENASDNFYLGADIELSDVPVAFKLGEEKLFISKGEMKRVDFMGVESIISNYDFTAFSDLGIAISANKDELCIYAESKETGHIEEIAQIPMPRIKNGPIGIYEDGANAVKNITYYPTVQIGAGYCDSNEITVTFDGNVDMSTVNAENIYISDGENSVEFEIKEKSGNTVILSISQDSEADMYRLYFSEEINDIYGNKLAEKEISILNSDIPLKSIEASINSMYITRDDGVYAIDEIAAGDFTAEMDIELLAQESVYADIAIAMYATEDGALRLKNVRTIKSKELLNGHNTVDFNETLPDEISCIKVFVVDSLNNMKPLSKVAIID